MIFGSPGPSKKALKRQRRKAADRAKAQAAEAAAEASARVERIRLQEDVPQLFGQTRPSLKETFPEGLVNERVPKNPQPREIPPAAMTMQVKFKTEAVKSEAAKAKAVADFIKAAQMEEDALALAVEMSIADEEDRIDRSYNAELSAIDVLSATRLEA